MKRPPPVNKPTLEERINTQEEWTFTECLGLATEYNMKVRAVVVTVMANGKGYKEGNH